MKKVCILITGDRDAQKRQWAETLMMDFTALLDGAERKVLIHGAARGIDTIGRDVWKDMHGGSDEDIRPFFADWYPNGQYDKAAGPKRNKAMLDEIVRRRKQGWEVVVVGYHPDLYGKSKGTRGMLEMADRAGFEVRFRDRPRATVKYVRPWEKQR